LGERKSLTVLVFVVELNLYISQNVNLFVSDMCIYRYILQKLPVQCRLVIVFMIQFNYYTH